MELDAFDTAMARPDVLMPVYAQQRKTFDIVMADSIEDGDDPAKVAKVVVVAATDAKPKAGIRLPASRQVE